MSKHIVCVGSAYQEAFLSYNSDIRLGHEIEVDKVTQTIGGAGVNTAVTFARQGLGVSLASAIGHDGAGMGVMDLLDREGIGRDFLDYSDSGHTGYRSSLVTPRGLKTSFVYGGVSGDFRHLDVSAILVARPAWVYVTSLGGNFDKLLELFQACAESGVKIAFSPGDGELAHPSKVKTLLEFVDWLIGNKEEISQIAHGETLDELVFHALNIVSAVAVTNRGGGALVSDGKSVVKSGRYEDVEVVDKSGTGDAFGSGLVASIILGKSLLDAVQFASANATAVLSNLGSNSSILDQSVKLHDMPIKETGLR
jgi:sugar/nucleoside kinase (ribokinase family)